MEYSWVTGYNWKLHAYLLQTDISNAQKSKCRTNSFNCSLDSSYTNGYQYKNTNHNNIDILGKLKKLMNGMDIILTVAVGVCKLIWM